MICGENVVLRELTRNDIPTVCRWYKDEEIRELVSRDLPSGLAECEQWFSNNKARRDCRLFALEDKQGNVIGEIELKHIAWKSKEGEISITLGEKKYWGKGLGAETLCLFLDWAFLTMGFNRIYLRVYTDNQRAIRCYKKVGFKPIGIVSQSPRLVKDPKNLLLMDISAPRYQKQKGG